MKSIVSLLAIAALSLVTSARAQDESPSSSPASEEKASATVEAPSAPSTLRDASPSPRPEKSTTTSSSIEKKAEATTSASPSAEKKEAAATSKTASKKPATDTGSAESNVKRLENEWEAAVMQHDASFIQARVADDFMGTSSKGKRQTKSGLLKDFKNDTDTYTSAKTGSVSVRAFGSNVAIATGTAKEAGKSKDGKPFGKTYAWTDTWMLKGSQWQCIGSHAMLVSGK